MRTAYTYTPYGSATSTGDITQPLQWSSEYADTELGLTYYNYRHYNPIDGRWIQIDSLKYKMIKNSYIYCINRTVELFDYQGEDYQYSYSDQYKKEETYDKQGYYKDAVGKADIAFPSVGAGAYIVKEGDYYCVHTPSVSYSGKITLYMDWNLEKDYRNVYYNNSKYNRVETHELHHVEIASDHWNNFVNESKIRTGCYCLYDCAKEAVALIQDFKNLYENYSRIDNANFDMSEYGLKMDKNNEMRKGIEKTLQTAISEVEAIEARINKRIEYVDQCSRT